MPMRNVVLHWGKAINDAGDKLDKPLTNEERGIVLDKRPDLAKRFAEMIQEAGFAIKNQLLVNVGDGRPSADLLGAGRFDYLNPDIVRLCPNRSARKPGTVTVEEVAFDHDWTFEEGLAKLKERGLNRLEWDDLPLICEQNPDRQRTRWMVSSMAPVDGGVLYAGGDPDGRSLDLDDVQDPWDRECVLLGIRE